MTYNFAARILASAEVDAISQEQFNKWDQARQAEYLKKHPTSKFGKGKGIPTTKPARSDAEFMQEWGKDNPAPAEKHRADDLGLKRVPPKAERLQALKDEARKLSTQIDQEVMRGARIGPNDPMSKRLAGLRQEIKRLS